MRRTTIAVLAAAWATACGGGGALPTGPSPVSADVELRYEVAAETTGVGARAQIVGCVGRAQVHPSWWGFSQVTMVPVDPRTWAVLFEDVPIGVQSIRVGAPEGCVPTTVTANAIRLNGGELSADGQPLFRFTLHPDGSVSQ